MAPLPRPGPWWWRHHPGWDRAARGLGRVESRPGGRSPASRRFTSRLRQAVLSSVMAASTTALTRVTAPSLGCANLPPARGAADGPPRPVPRRASSAAARQRGGTGARRHGGTGARRRWVGPLRPRWACSHAGRPGSPVRAHCTCRWPVAAWAIGRCDLRLSQCDLALAGSGREAGKISAAPTCVKNSTDISLS